jgi:hypothetical protein
MEVQAIVDANVGRGQDDGLAVVHEAHVADEGFVEDFVDLCALMARALREAAAPGAFGHRQVCRQVRHVFS